MRVIGLLSYYVTKRNLSELMAGYTSALSDEYFVEPNTLPRPAERINSKLTEGWVR